MPSKRIKCIIWDLDDTLWRGVLSEGDELELRGGVKELIVELDQRGILHAIASRNDEDQAMDRLESFGLKDYFLYPQIHWGVKSASVQTIVDSLNLGKDSMLFLDDQAFEREEVRGVHPEVRAHHPEDLAKLLADEELFPRQITVESSSRRKLYRDESRRKKARARFDGPEEGFLRSLEMELSLAPAGEKDLERAEELTERTNQLNTTGIPYGIEELKKWCSDSDRDVLLARLRDRFGDYGIVGLVLLDRREKGVCRIELLLMSCRVMSRGTGGVVINLLRHRCKDLGLRLQARFRPTERNRQMYITYRFAGFRELDQEGDIQILDNDLEKVPSSPDYIKLDLRSFLEEPAHV